MIEIPLTQGYRTFVSDEDADLSEHRWSIHLTKKGGVYARGWHREDGAPGKLFLLHRVIAKRMGLDIDQFPVDHINGDGLFNCRENLRVVSYAENAHNRGHSKHSKTGVLGVCFEPVRGRYRAYIRRDGRPVSLGYSYSLGGAIELRLAAERELWGVQPRRAAAHAS